MTKHRVLFASLASPSAAGQRTGPSRMTLLALAVLTTIGQAQGAPRPLPIDVLLTAPTLATVALPTFAPDGQSLAYTVIDNRRREYDATQFSRTGVPWSALGGDIWVSGTMQGAPRRLTQGQGDNWAPSWSPDGNYIAFLSDSGIGTPPREAHLWIWERASGALRQVSDTPVVDPWHDHLEWTADSRSVAVRIPPRGCRVSATLPSSGALRGTSARRLTRPSRSPSSAPIRRMATPCPPTTWFITSIDGSVISRRLKWRREL